MNVLAFLRYFRSLSSNHREASNMGYIRTFANYSSIFVNIQDILLTITIPMYSQECQSLIEDNRRLISAADRQPRTRSTGAEDENDDDPVRTSSAVLDHHRYLPSYKQKQHLKQPNFYYQQQRQTSSASPFISSSSNGVSGGGCNTSKNHVETVVLQTKIDTLQWQLKQVSTSDICNSA